MTAQILESYATHALSCTEQMYLLAEQADWNALAQLEAERLEVLTAMFDHPSMPMLLAQVADTIRHIIELDQKTIALSKKAQQTLKKEMELLNQGKRAVDAYLDNINYL